MSDGKKIEHLQEEIRLLRSQLSKYEKVTPKSSDTSSVEKNTSINTEILSSFVENNPSLIIGMDLKGNPKYMNESTCRKFPSLSKEKRNHAFLDGLIPVIAMMQELEINSYIRELEVDDNWYQQAIYYDKERESIGIYAFDITEKMQLEREKARLASFPELSVSPIIEISLDGEVTYTNPVAEKMFPEIKGKCIDHPLLEGILVLVKKLQRVNKNSFIREVEYDNDWYEQAIQYIKSIKCIRISLQDVSWRKKNEEEMRKLSMAIEQSSDWLIITDKDGIIEYSNDAVTTISGYSKEELIGSNITLLKSDQHDDSFYQKLWKTVVGGDPFHSLFINRTKKGELYYIDLTITPLKDSNYDITHYVSSGKDITEQRDMKERIYSLAYYDALTKLPNRTLFIDRISQSIARGGHSSKFTAVFTLDIDRFGLINDISGHQYGDTLLREVSKRLKKVIRDGDTIARLGSDEFGIVFTDIAQKDDIMILGKNVLTVASEPLEIDGEEKKITFSIGISLFPGDGTTASQLMENSNISMTQVKNDGGNGYKFYTSEMNERAVEFVVMENKLRYALQENRFKLFYQPYCSTETGKLIGMEALLRMQDERKKLISPVKFIPILEETGLIVPVGEWIVEEVCAQLEKWNSSNFPTVPVSLNLSPIQFNQRDLGMRIASIIKNSPSAAEMLTIEVTESTFLDDLEFAISVLKKLRDMGAAISIDDFGTGYSSMSYIKRLPVDNLKIDISFIREITTDPDDKSIVTAIIMMAKSLNLKTIAEGVETEDQLKILNELKCNMVQGYYFSPPVSPDDTGALFKHS